MGDFDPGYVAAMAVIMVVAVAILIDLLPMLFAVVWQLLPGVVILLVIVAVLRGMVGGFFH
jgi:hypothetical protein